MITRTMTLAVCALALTLFASAQEQIIPRPAEITYGDGQPFSLKGGAAISSPAGDPAFGEKVRQFARILEQGTGQQIRPGADGANRIVIQKDPALNDKGDEAYRIESKKGLLTISASSPKGVFYAAQSLGQIFGPEFFNPGSDGKAAGEWTLGDKPFTVVDYPRFARRHMLMDEARHFFGEQTIKQIIDQMAQIKMNVLHWHLTNDAGWRIEIKKYPRLTQVGSKRRNSEIGTWGSGRYSNEPHEGFYTQEKIKEIVKYAAERNVTIMPEICMPGHFGAASVAYPWLSLKPLKEVPAEFVTNIALDPTNEKTYRFLSDVLDEVYTLFPSTVVHIGGDEVRFKDQWAGEPKIEEFMKKHKLSSLGDVQVYFTNRMVDIIAKKNHRPMGWNEILGDDVNNDGGGKPTVKLNPIAIIHFWKGGSDLAKRAIKEGHDVINGTSWYTYMDYSYGSISLGKAYSFEPVFDGLEEEYQGKVIGLSCQMWTEWISDTDKLYRYMFPRLCAYAETGWSPKERKDFQSFKKRMDTYGQILDLQGIGYAKDMVNELTEADFFNTPKVGEWTPEAIAQGKEQAYDLTALVKSPGEYTATFLYMKGGHAVTLKSVALYEDGREIARDTHDAFSGVEKRNIQYKLTVPKVKEGAKYEMRAVLTGDAGTDSRGNVYVQAP